MIVDDATAAHLADRFVRDIARELRGVDRELHRLTQPLIWKAAREVAADAFRRSMRRGTFMREPQE